MDFPEGRRARPRPPRVLAGTCCAPGRLPARLELYFVSAVLVWSARPCGAPNCTRPCGPCASLQPRADCGERPCVAPVLLPFLAPHPAWERKAFLKEPGFNRVFSLLQSACRLCPPVCPAAAGGPPCAGPPAWPLCPPCCPRSPSLPLWLRRTAAHTVPCGTPAGLLAPQSSGQPAGCAAPPCLAPRAPPREVRAPKPRSGRGGGGQRAGMSPGTELLPCLSQTLCTKATMQTVRAADTNEVVKLIFRESDTCRISYKSTQFWYYG